MIGRAIEADRVYVFENGFHPATGVVCASQRAEWCAPGASNEIENPELQNLPYEQLAKALGDVLVS